MYDELEETTTHYYDELGKLSEAPLLSKKDRKKLQKLLISHMFLSVELILKQEKESINQGKVLLKEDKQNFKQKHKSSIWAKTVNFFKKIGKNKENIDRGKKVEILTNTGAESGADSVLLASTTNVVDNAKK